MPIITREICKTYLGITATTNDELIDMLISQVEADYERIRNREFDMDSNDWIEYPEGSELTAAQMIGYKINQLKQCGGSVDIKAESIGDYSYSRMSGQDLLYGYPKSIISTIVRYVKLK